MTSGARSHRLIGVIAAFFLSVAVLPAATAFGATPTAPTCVGTPRLGATFVSGTAAPVSAWSIWNWEQELLELQQVCINTVILQATATNPAGTDNLTRLYGSGAATDVPKNLLAAADQIGGFNVYLGLQSEDGWGDTVTAAWATSAATVSTQVASELLADIGTSPSLRGWYITPEPSSAGVATNAQQSAFAGYVSQTAAQLHALLPGSKVMLAPGFDTWAPAATFSALMQAVASAGVDILTLQDRTGEPFENASDISGSPNGATLATWFGLAQAAVSSANAAGGGSVALWSDVETYRTQDWTPATTQQVVAALNAEAPYVQGFASFSYVHYMSGYGWFPAYFGPYLHYVQTGGFPTYGPTVPVLKAQLVRTDATLSWPAAKDQPSAGYLPVINEYLLYRTENGGPPRLMAALRTSQTGTSCPSGRAYCFTDPQLDPGATYAYTLQAVNGVGNASSATVTVTVGTVAGPSDLALGAPHSVVPAPASGYPETDGSLVDGVVGTVNDQDPAWVGWMGVNPTVTVDLGQAQTVTEIDSAWLQQLSAGVVTPASVTYQVSADDSTWTTLPLASAPNITVADQVVTYRGFPASAAPVRWVRVTATGAGGWLFASEITVHGPLPLGGRSGYVVSRPPSPSYPDSGGRLTDAKTGAQGTPSDPEWVGWWQPNGVSISLVLPKSRSVKKVTLNSLVLPSWDIDQPSAINVATSTNGATYQPAAVTVTTNITTGNVVATLTSPTAARYVRVTIDAAPATWALVSEVTLG